MRSVLRVLRRDPVWLFLLALGVRLVGIGAESFWYDENFTAWITGRLSWDQMFRAILGDVHPPLWYVLIKIISDVFGQSEILLRLPAALFGAGAVVLTYLIARDIWPSKRITRGAGLLACFMPATLYYAQDARMYPMLAFFVLLATLGAVRENWALLALGSIGALYSQNLAIFYVAVLFGIVLWRARNWAVPKLIQPAMALTVVLMCWEFWAVHLFQQARDISDGFWIQPVTLPGAFLPVGTMTIGTRVGDGFQLHLYAAAMILTLYGVYVYWRNRTVLRKAALIYGVTFAPPLLMALVSVVWKPIYLPRAMIASSYLMAIVWIMPLLWSKGKRWARLLIVPTFAMGVLGHYFPASGRDNLTQFTAPIRAGWQPGDVIYHTGLSTAISIGYYTQGLPYALRPQASDLNQTLSPETKAAFGFVESDISQLAQQYRRAWVITAVNPMSRVDELTAIKQIEEEYRPELIYRNDSDYAYQVIYLVRFK